MSPFLIKFHASFYTSRISPDSSHFPLPLETKLISKPQTSISTPPVFNPLWTSNVRLALHIQSCYKTSYNVFSHFHQKNLIPPVHGGWLFFLLWQDHPTIWLTSFLKHSIDLYTSLPHLNINQGWFWWLLELQPSYQIRFNPWTHSLPGFIIVKLGIIGGFLWL